MKVVLASLCDSDIVLCYGGPTYWIQIEDAVMLALSRHRYTSFGRGG